MSLAGRTALIVDDTIATGATARVACLVARARGARRVIVALRRDADEVTCLHAVPPIRGGGTWYGDFAQVTDAEAAALLAAGPTSAVPGDAAPDPAEVTVNARTRWSSTSTSGPVRS